MTTYNSYEAAKIANPDGVILENSGVFDVMDNVASSQINRWSKCNPADHCDTVEKFLADGNELTEGDVIINANGNVNVITSVDCKALNLGGYSIFNDGRFILRAAVLETKDPKRTKVEYVKITDTGFFDLKGEFQSRGIFFNESVTDTPDYVTAMDVKELAHHFLHKNLFRRIETPIEWWEDAAEFMSELAELSITEDGDLRVMMLKDQIGFGMSRDKWCDFARILLEQGE